MVCVLEEGNALCIVRDMTTTNAGGSQNKLEIFLPATTTVQALFEELGRKYQYEPNSFEVILQRNPDGESVILNEHKDKTIDVVGVNFEPGARNTLIMTDMHAPPRRRTPAAAAVGDTGEDDMQLGASSSPNASFTLRDMHAPAAVGVVGEDDMFTGLGSGGSWAGGACSGAPSPTASGDYVLQPLAPRCCPLLPAAVTASTVTSEYSSYASALINRHDTGYVGLVNQAMTCYLNSLIQALYMTPEFRNALYTWHYEGTDYEESKNIPYQLQKLFLNLQTSDKTAVETTELTRSFGWDSSEAWQQHDIQELCRVMFDALEQTFKNTKQADLILSLYEGKMIDYVKCLECSTEKSREDTFLDIPLPVRPFGSTVAYGSVEEALRAFVQPETLDGNNQYHCDKCAKKCDAHKGLKFSKFPYLLTLHLKRFDFDYNTMHRIKLNDKVMFPETLNLNSFITTAGCKEESECVSEETIVKNDDSSTTDSGSALDDENCQSEVAPSTQEQSDYQDDDEGIADVTNGPHNHENEKNRIHSLEKGPYSYELFSIMIHSGSASGGHYYAYIKDFKEGAWYCFNDQSVSRITYDDIRKTYGGGPMRGYYSGAYSSSTNAYMLMYRQIDKERNCSAMTVEELPPHIQVLLRKVQEREETDRMLKEQEMDMCKIKLFAHHPTQKQVVESKLSCHNQSPLSQVTEWAHANLELQGVVPLERCRLVNYDRLQDSIECSFEGRESEPIADILGRLSSNYKYDLLLEIRNENSQFEVYQPGGVATKVFVVDVPSQEVDGPTIVRGNLSQTVGDFKLTLAKALNLNSDTIKVVLEKYSNEPRLLEKNENTLKFEGFYGSNKIFVASMIDEDPEKPFIISQLHQVIDRFEHILTLHMVLPDTEKETLDKMSIPTLSVDVNHNGTSAPVVETLDVSSSPSHPREPSPQPPDTEDDGFGTTTGHSDQSNSEDSSLTDSDRTIVGDMAPDEGLAQLSSPSNSSPGSEQQNISSPEDGFSTNCYTYAKDELASCENWDEDNTTSTTATRTVNYYFKASPYISCDNQKMLKVLVDKRMILGKLKRCLEPHVGVPVEFFKLYRLYSGQQQEIECLRLNESLSSYRDDEKLTIKLGRALRKGEHRGKVYQLFPNSAEPIKFLCDWILGKDMTVGEAKREILQELRQKYAIDIPFERCRLRKKSWKNPTKIHMDSDKFDDIGLFANWELFLQELTDPEPVTSSSQLALFVRRWCPSTMELAPFSEVVLDTPTVNELKVKLSALSGIPLENVEFAKPQGSFPCETSVLSVHTDLEWDPTPSALDSWPLNITEDGHVIFYRDSKEELKELSNEERKELANKEGISSNRYYSKVATYSPRKERALKIYLDPPTRRQDVEVD